MRELNLFGEATDGEAKVAGIDIRRVNVSIIEVKVVSGIGERVSVGGSCVAMVVGVSERHRWCLTSIHNLTLKHSRSKVTLLMRCRLN